MNKEAQTIQQEIEEATKMLGAHVPMSLYWEFKKAAAGRNEQLKEAVVHAARMYIDAIKAQA
jgi:hypothetical protein